MMELIAVDMKSSKNLIQHPTSIVQYIAFEKGIYKVLDIVFNIQPNRMKTLFKGVNNLNGGHDYGINNCKYISKR